MGRVELGIGGDIVAFWMGTYMLVCNYLTLKCETWVVSLMEVWALLSAILDVFYWKRKVQMVVVPYVGFANFDFVVF